MALSLITCTGGRPEAFGLLEWWIAQQAGVPFEWIVVDDVDPPTPTTMGQTIVRPSPRWLPGGAHTLARNLAAGLAAAKNDKVLFIEDDEAYLPGYLQGMDSLLDVVSLAGQMRARYYNVRTRQFRVFQNRRHASLCQTGIRGAAMKARLLSLCRVSDASIDLRLWQASGALCPDAENVVSTKGLPGRPGIGIGHRPEGPSWIADPAGAQLSAWLGPAAAAKYERFST